MSMPDDVNELVESARRIEGPSSEVEKRLRARLFVPPIPPAPARGLDPSGSSSTAAGTASWIGARVPWWTVAAAFVLGAGLGRLTSGAHSGSTTAANNSTESPETIRPLSAPSPSTPMSSPPGTEQADLAPLGASSGSIATATIPRSSNGGSPAASQAAIAKPTGELAGERRILDVARAALGRGNAEGAALACDQHALKYPHGLLAEEREAIAIQALVDEHQAGPARERADRFRRNYPKSILLPTIEAALGGPQ